MPSRVGVTFGLKSNRLHYETALRAVGLDPIAITPADPLLSLEGLDGLLLSGGADVGDQPERDAIEGSLLRLALSADLPVFGICRGLQFMNFEAGGTLLNHIEGHRGPESARTVRHRVRVASGSVLASITGEEFEANSRHHQAIDQLAATARLTAVAADGTKEAIEFPGSRWAVAVQWHPEEMLDEEPHRRLFASFADAVRFGTRQAR